jgi:hypothetical protein
MVVIGSFLIDNMDYVGVMTVILFATFAFYYTDKPKKHRFISEFELNKINRGKFEVSKGAERRIPWKAIIKTPAVWAVWLVESHFFLNYKF